MAWYNASWDYRVKVTIQNSEIDSTLTDYPVYVALSDLPAGFHSNCNQTDARDIRVTRSDGTTECPIDNVVYDSAGDTGELHFKANSVSSSAGTDFYIYYGNAGASMYASDATYGAENVWTEGYVAVYHFQDNLTDSTANSYDLTGAGSLTYAAGKLEGKEVVIDADGDHMSISDANGPNIDNTAPHTWGGWMYVVNNGYYNTPYFKSLSSNREGEMFQDAGDKYFKTYHSIGGSQVELKSTTAYGPSNVTAANSTWYHWLRADDGSNPRMFVNNVKWTRSATGTRDNDGLTTYIGVMQTWPLHNRANFDEIRLCDDSKSDAWIKADYVNQATPNTFYVVGSQEEAPLGVNYSYYASLTVDNTKVSGSSNLTDFTILVSGVYDGTGSEPDIRTTGNGGNIQNTTTGGNSGSVTVPADLVFSPNTDGSAPYDFEIQEYNAATGEIIAWVEIPSLLYASDTVLYMVYGDSGVSTSQEDVTGTWASNNWQAVYHLQNYYDSTANSNDLTTTNAPTASTAGAIGDCYDWENSGSAEGLFITDANQTGLDLSGDSTVMYWTNPESFPADGYASYCVSKDDVGSGGRAYSFGFRMQSTTKQMYNLAKDPTGVFDYAGHSVTYSAGTFYHNVHTTDISGTPYDSPNDQNEYFKNGASIGNDDWYSGAVNNIASIANTAAAFSLGCYMNSGAMAAGGFGLDGKLDEVRVSTNILSDDWIATEYNTQSDPANFYSMGNETELGGGPAGIAASKRSIQAS